ncbi:hypothetical protein CL628_04150 [bacterium]|nr:hypothetical protein [bacterium]
MKQFTCLDATPEGGTPCDFVAQGETSEEVINMMKAHAGEKHADLIAQATPESMATWEQMAPTKVTDV